MSNCAVCNQPNNTKIYTYNIIPKIPLTSIVGELTTEDCQKLFYESTASIKRSIILHLACAEQFKYTCSHCTTTHYDFSSIIDVDCMHTTTKICITDRINSTQSTKCFLALMYNHYKKYSSGRDACFLCNYKTTNTRLICITPTSFEIVRQDSDDPKEVHNMSDGRKICNDCFVNNKMYMCSCKRVYDKTVKNKRLMKHTQKCNYCVANNEKVQPYSTRVPVEIVATPKDVFSKFMVGFELEVDFGARRDSANLVAASIYNANNIYICKSDSSIHRSNDTLEFVTRPMSMKYVWQKDNEIWDAINKIITAAYAPTKRNDMNENAGLHISLNRKAFTRVHLLRFCNFIYANIPFMTFIGGRELNRWCHSTIYETIPDKINRDNDRYTAVNLTSKDRVELRLFKSKLNKEHILCCIELCHALYLFTKDCSIMDSTNLKKFIAFLDTYPGKVLLKKASQFDLTNYQSAKLPKSKRKMPPLDKLNNPRNNEGFIYCSCAECVAALGAN